MAPIIVSEAKKPSGTRRRRGGGSRSRKTKPAETLPETSDVVTALELEPPETEIVTMEPERAFAARVPPPAPVRPRPAVHHAVFFDVENTSRPEHISRVLDHLNLDWIGRSMDLIAVGNWRVVSHETARILARRGAQLVHSAPAVGVRDWSDLRIAVAAGAWLAAARPGDAIEIITDDQAFDAVGDVATSLGVTFRRLSYRALAGNVTEPVPEETSAPTSGRSRRRRRGGRRHRETSAPSRVSEARGRPEPSHAPLNGSDIAAEPHTAPSEEIVDVVRELLRVSPGGVGLDALSNTLKARGFSRPPGSPRLITRLRRIEGLEVAPGNIVRLVGEATEAAADDADSPEASGEAATGDGGSGPGTPRRRRRRGGRRRRGRGHGGSAVATAT